MNIAAIGVLSFPFEFVNGWSSPMLLPCRSERTLVVGYIFRSRTLRQPGSSLERVRNRMCFPEVFQFLFMYSMVSE
ncbi:hypothetical protein BDZ45DRAFT_104889 [Acephala macrosclerotiorum]|nr:hypothetical protein BDZ45DRAFT_104889 [Acephala macrosclerotiorum]